MSVFSHLEQRALSAYYRNATKQQNGLPGQVMQPGSVQEVEIDGLRYVVLTNVQGILAVYRVRVVNGEPVLKGLKRWPVGVSEFAGVEHGA